MAQSKGKAARIFLLIIGVIMLLGGFIMVYAGIDNLKDALVNNAAFFLTGGILIYLGLTYKKKKQ